MPKVPEAQLAVRREQMLDAAIACFARNGFHQTTMDDIAREGGVSAGLIYRYFANKEDVVEATVRARERARAARFHLAQQKAGTVQVLDELVNLYFARMVEPDTIREMELQLYSEVARNPRVRELVRTAWDDLLARIEELVRRGQGAGGIDPALEPSVLGRLLLAAYIGLHVQRTVDPKMDVWECVEFLKTLYRGRSWRDGEAAPDGRSERSAGPTGPEQGG